MEQLTEQMQQANLSEKEQAVMEKILSNISNTVFLSGAQLAEYCDVSAPYITRLVRKLGYTKFSEFKEVLSERYRRATSPYDMFQSFSDESGITDVVKESLLQDIGNITAMEKLLDVSVLDRAVDAIDRCSTVYGVAMFASEVAIHMLEHYLWRLNKPFIEATGIGLSKKIEFSGIGSDDVLIAFSSQRVLKEVRDAAVTARRRGTTVIAITDNAANPLACASDLVLLAPVTGVSVDYTHVATLAMINLIINSLARKNPEKVRSHLSQEVDNCSARELFCL